MDFLSSPSPAQSASKSLLAIVTRVTSSFRPNNRKKLWLLKIL